MFAQLVDNQRPGCIVAAKAVADADNEWLASHAMNDQLKYGNPIGE